MRRSPRSVLLALALIAVLASAAPAFGQDDTSTTGEETSVPAAAGEFIPGLDPALVGLPLTERGAASFARLQEADDHLRSLQARAAELDARRRRLEIVMNALTVEERRHARELVAAEEQLGQAAANAYKSAGSLSGIGMALDAGDADELTRSLKLSSNTAERLDELSETAREARRRAGAAARAVADDLVTNRADLEAVAADIRKAEDDRDAALDAATSVAGRLTIRGTDLPLVVLDAYVRASRVIAFVDPECRLPWWALAGVGKVESNHARFGGARTTLEGQVEPPIYGIPLNGRPGVAAIGDSDGGFLDADRVWDRAVGPMQFIPGSWRRWSRDGNADGRADPQNIYDAALAAGDYLCAAAPTGLVDDPALVRAYLSYNASLPYAARVLDLARGYQSELGELG